MESEVVRLRESDVNLMQERDKLRGQVAILRDVVIFNNIPLPAGIDELPTASAPPRTLPELDMPATVSYSADEFNNDRLHVNFSQQDPSRGYGYPMTSPYEPPQNTQSGQDFPNGWCFPDRTYHNS